MNAFQELKKRLVCAPIIPALDWSLPFEVICKKSDYAVGAALGQHHNKLFHHVYYANKTLNDA